MKVRLPPQISLGVSVHEGWLNLKVDAEGMNTSEIMRILFELQTEKEVLPDEKRRFSETTDDDV